MMVSPYSSLIFSIGTSIRLIWEDGNVLHHRAFPPVTVQRMRYYCAVNCAVFFWKRSMAFEKS